MTGYARSRAAVTIAPAASVSMTPIATVGHSAPAPSAKSATPASRIVNAASNIVYVFMSPLPLFMRSKLNDSRVPR